MLVSFDFDCQLKVYSLEGTRESRVRSSWCCGLSHLSSMGWVGGRDQIWTDMGSQGHLYKLTSNHIHIPQSKPIEPQGSMCSFRKHPLLLHGRAFGLNPFSPASHFPFKMSVFETSP